MARRLPLDTRFAIAQAFDNGQLRGDCTVNEIADVVGVNRKTVGRTLKVVGFTLVRKVQPLYERITARWSPPRKWPELKRHSPLTQGVVDLYDAGRWSGRCYASDLAPLLEASEKAVAHALRRLKFTIVKKSHLKFVRMEQAVWRRPYAWPEVFQKQRELRRSGLSTGQVIRATELSAEVVGIIENAVRKLDVAELQLYQRGKMKAKIKEVVQEIYRKATFDHIARQELAGWLGESPDANVQYLQTRVEGYVRFATNRICPHCGRHPAQRRENHRATEPIGTGG